MRSRGLGDMDNGTSNVTLRVPETSDYVQAVIVALTALGTVSYNALIIVVFLLNHRLLNPFTCYVLNLVASDMLLAVFGMTGFIADILNPPSIRGAYCGWYNFASKGAIILVCYALLLISLDRLWSLQYPLSYSRIRSVRLSAIICSCIWVFVGGLLLPYIIRDRLLYNVREDVCTFNYGAQTSYSLVIEFVGFDGPPILVLAFYGYIFFQLTKRRLRKKRAFRQGAVSAGLSRTTNNSDHERTMNSAPHDTNVQSDATGQDRNGVRRDQREEKRFFRLFGLLSLSVLVCWGPGTVYFLLAVFIEGFWIQKWYAASVCLQFLSCVLNPFIYHASLPEVKRAINDLSRKVWKW